MKLASRSPLDLLEPGALLGGALFGSLLNGAANADRLPAGTRLGPFRVVEEIGRGGMGVVYRAERDDGEYQQSVAIKSLASSGSPQGLELFRRERQMLAGLKHPHIARLLDGGHQTDGRLWFAMELINGQPIDAHAQAAKLSVEQRLELVRQVINAVAFAHQRLLIHRDIKPGNVLVDADGSVKLLDFGIAALAGDEDAARAYSPGWASPEQLAGQAIGPASDQFQLGLLLDSVLHPRVEAMPGSTVGAAVADATAAEGKRHAARTVSPQHWMPIAEGRRRELVAIAARATSPVAELRYGSVAELGAEIDRWLQSRPVAAHGGGIAYTIRCAARRHPAIASIAVASTVALVALIAAFNWRLSQERDVARAQADRAESIKDFLVGLFRDGDPTRGSDPDLSARALIQSGVLRVETDRALPVDVRGELMQLLADIQLRLGDGKNAEGLIGRIDRNAIDPGLLAEMEGRLAMVHGRPKDAVRHLAAAAAHQDSPERQLLLARAQNEAGEGAQAAARLGALLRDPDALPDALAASAWLSLGVQHWREGNPKAALTDYDRALERASRATAPMSPVPMRINRGLALIDLARVDEALSEFAKAETELARFPNLKLQGLLMQNRGMALLRRGDVEEAKSVWTDLLSMVDDGVNPGLEASTVHNLASSADRLGDPLGALQNLVRAEHLREQLGDAPAALSSHINVIAKLYSVGLAEEGVRLAAQAATRAEGMARPDLAARARLAGATSRCVLDRRRCVALLDASAKEFAAQDNHVKRLETYEKLALFAFEEGEEATLVRATDSFARTMEAPESAADATDAADLRSRLALLHALAARDGRALASLASESQIARRALVQMELERGDVAAARSQMDLLPEESSDRYWLLRERVAIAARDQLELQRARAARTEIRARVQAILVRPPDHASPAERA